MDGITVGKRPELCSFKRSKMGSGGGGGGGGVGGAAGRCGEGVVYPTDIGLQLGKACYPFSK